MRQGRKLDGGPAVLGDHSDVLWTLNEKRHLPLGARTEAHLAFVEAVRGDVSGLVDFLAPVCEVFCREGGIRSADRVSQTLAGYGYLAGHWVRQMRWDTRIIAI